MEQQEGAQVGDERARATMASADWGAMPEDVCKIVVRHVDLAALVRFGAVCHAWRQVLNVTFRLCPEYD